MNYFFKLLLLFVVWLIGCHLNAKYPGNISNDLRLWLKANANVSCSVDGCDVDSWTNMMTITDVPTSFSNTGSQRPKFGTHVLNYNSGILFSSGSRLNGAVDKAIIPYSTNVSKLTIISVVNSSSSAGTILSDNFKYSSGSSADQGWEMGVGNTWLTLYTAVNGIDFRSEANGTGNRNHRQSTSDNFIPNSNPYIINVSQDFVTHTNSVYAKNLTSSTTTSQHNPGTYDHTRIVKNGVLRTVLGTSDDNQRGYWSPFFEGSMNEVIVFDRELTLLESRKIHSYLAIKYSLTLDRIGVANNYVNSTGGTIYSDGGVGTYWNDIIGIGRDNGSVLVQKQSKQQDNLTKIYISSLATTNLLNGGTFASNNQWVVMGHNNAPLYSATFSNEFPTGLGIYSRIDREWKITNTNFNSTFSLDISLATAPIDVSDLRVLIDDDGDFTDATMYNPSMSYSSGVLTIAGLSNSHIPINDTKYLTIVSLTAITPLGIEVSNFEATLINRGMVDLTWITKNETNSDQFIIESTQDGKNWEEVLFHPAIGASNHLTNYILTDTRVYNGTMYYRLKVIDKNGAIAYSDIKSVTVVNNGIQIFPNPTSGLITVQSDSPINNWEVINSLGENVGSMIHVINKQQNNIVMDCSSLNAGVYIISSDGNYYRFVKE